MASVPSELRYTKEHEWVRVEGGLVVVGITEYAADALGDVVLVLHEPRLAGHELTYRVDVLNGTLPPTGGACSLFIDAFGRSLAPVSVRGVRRRSPRPAP